MAWAMGWVMAWATDSFDARASVRSSLLNAEHLVFPFLHNLFGARFVPETA